MHKIRVVIVALATVSSAVAGAQELATRHARSLAAGCANCHSGGSSAVIPSLVGMPESAIVRAMQEFKAGTRTGTVMPQLAKGYTDAQIAAVAQWYARAR